MGVKPCHKTLYFQTLVLDTRLQAATYLRERTRFFLAEPLLRRALRLREQRPGEEHLPVVQLLTGLAILDCRQNTGDRVQVLYEQALHICAQAQEGGALTYCASALQPGAHLPAGEGSVCPLAPNTPIYPIC
ncbi:MAG TPA: hypothetical protein VGF67_09425 [Ktedonobacteraceae bacterium]